MGIRSHRPRPRNRRKEPSAYRDAWSVLVLLLAGVAFACLLSYDPADIPQNQSPPNNPALNWFGPFGAWVAYQLLMFFGLGAFLVTGAGFALALLALFSSRSKLWPQLLCGAMLTLCLLLLLHHQPWFFSEQLSALNLTGLGIGGIVSRLLMDQLLARYLGRVGASIVTALAAVAFLFGLLRLHPYTFLRGLRRLGRALVMPPFWIVRELARLVVGGARLLRNVAASLQARFLEWRLARATAAAARESVDEPAAPRPRRRLEPESHPGGGPGGARRPPPPPRPPGGPPRPPPPRQRAPAAATGTGAAAEHEPPPVATRVIIRGQGREAGPRRPPAQSLVRPSTSQFRLPSLDLLNRPDAGDPSASVDELKRRAEVLQTTLQDFGVNARVGQVEQGPVITRFEVHPAPGVKVERISALSNNIALAMEAANVRILAPIPGKAAVGIEIPNVSIQKVRLREILDSPDWTKSKARLPLAIGKDVAGRPIVADLADMPHLLIAGATGAGKTVCVNSLIVALVFALGPDELRFLLVDPKIVEMQHYNRLPHLVAPVVSDPKKVPGRLRWATQEMERRYQMLAQAGVRNIQSYNTLSAENRAAANERLRQKLLAAGLGEDFVPMPERLPYVVIIIDELADLMLVAPAEIEGQIARLAQLSRAVGIHMVLATQRPSVDVITGVIKANFPARISFQVASKVDSRTILDANGAETLIGKGDMLFLPAGHAKPVRIQGALVLDEEIDRIIEFFAAQGVSLPESDAWSGIDSGEEGADEAEMEEEGEDPKLADAFDVIRQTGRASVSVIQRRLRVGYSRAARMMDQLEARGIVGPADGSGPREILVDLERYEFS